MSESPSLISLFSGAGGLDYGFEAAGFSTLVALEMDAVCCRTLRASRSWSVMESDLLTTPSEEILRVAGLLPGDLECLIGGPPCQPFSKSGWWRSGDSLRLGDPRSNTLGGYLRVLKDASPKAFLLENVEGLAFEGKDDGLRLLLEEIKDINESTGTQYDPVVLTLNAADYGVPQTRSRIFIVGSRDGTRLKKPIQTHADPSQETLSFYEPWTTAWDAIGDLVEPEEDLALRGKWADLLPSIPEGHNYLWHTERMKGRPIFGWRRRYWNFLLKLAKDRPSWTIQAQPGPATGPFHWNNRRLSPLELARLQTFPADVQFQGTLNDVQRQIGNAVPSLLAEVVAREIRTQILGWAVNSATPLLACAKRGSPPPAEPVREVSSKYLPLVGVHPPHPGSGRGFSYESGLSSR